MAVAEQTQEQFELLYGNRATWSQTTKAAFDVLFEGAHRPVAAREHGITPQTIQRFFETNKLKHIANTEYAQAGQLIKAE